MKYWTFAHPVPKPDNESLEGLRLAAGATMKHIMYEHVALITKVVFAILTPIAIERAHPFTHVRYRRSLKRQCTRETVRVCPDNFLSGHPTKKKKGEARCLLLSYSAKREGLLTRSSKA
jgi:hypothetical protein